MAHLRRIFLDFSLAPLVEDGAPQAMFKNVKFMHVTLNSSGLSRCMWLYHMGGRGSSPLFSYVFFFSLWYLIQLAHEKKRAPWQGEGVFLPTPLVLPQGLSLPLALQILVAYS